MGNLIHIGGKIMGKCKSVEDLKKDVTRIYYVLLKIRETNGKINGVRCYESARIFYNVLKTLGYNVEVVNGGYALSGNDNMRHSWVEQIVDCYGTSILIETTPHLFFHDLKFEELVEKMVILPNDKRRKKYKSLGDETFLQVLKAYDEEINEDLIENYSSTLIEFFEKMKK